MRLAGIPLRVKPSFLVVVCLLGMPIVRYPTVEPPELVGRLAVWLGVVLVSVVIHELGHALLARRFGADVTMELWALGGLTTWQPVSRPIPPVRRAAIAAAGSALGLVVGAAVYPLWKMAGPPVGLVSLALGWIVWVNLGWGLINWLPIRLLDGGHIFRGVIDALWPERADRIANLFFLFTSAAAALVAFRLSLPIAGLFAAFMLIMEIRRLLGAAHRTGRPPPPPLPDRFLLEPPSTSDPASPEGGPPR
ncbi:MAG: site-2 protease family protein [bacterium]|nr:site-2 protease family protein [bacterium]